ncbi:BgTH12-07266 [Blumeria graminis f. sp. triticale]|uniref:Protein YOP1 n=1 Tax=Blumeria graminis f. sp. triticale TaxID=1689686 RepID=A0A9W4DEI1_BLUGR|nr:BgTH12-07266 [Blumeria graminis f. sp. triticale]
MFDIIARLLSSVPSFLFPVFASYKALNTSDPETLTPWLMYWVVLACALFIESWTAFILAWVPFYSWIRLACLLYLILPQTQGAKFIYLAYVHPFLQKNELAIDEFISSTHDRVKGTGIEYCKKAVELIKRNIFGAPQKQSTPPSSPSDPRCANYAQNLMAKFRIRPENPLRSTDFDFSSVTTSTDFRGIFTSAVTAATSRELFQNSSRNRSHSGISESPNMSCAERLSFISAQRERLTALLSELEKEAATLQDHPKSYTKAEYASQTLRGSIPNDEDESKRVSTNSTTRLSKSRSEADFEQIEAESTIEELQPQPENSRKNSWLPWSWRNNVEKPHSSTPAQLPTSAKSEEKPTTSVSSS